MKTYSKPQAKIAVLRAARKRIANDLNSMVCLALHEACDSNARLSSLATKELLTYVQNAISPHTTLGSWQRANAVKAQGLRDLKKDRLAWIDWMIDCIEDLQ